MMAGLDSLYHNDLGDAAEQGSYSSFSSPGGTSSLRHRRLDEPFHSSAHASLEDNIESVGQNAGDRIQPIQQIKTDLPETPRGTVSNVGDQYANIALNTTGLFVEHVVCHPLIILRRQCQVGGGEGATFRTHLAPFSLIPVVIHIYQCQGLSAFYKGLSSTLIVRGLQLAAEDATTKFTPWPKELSTVNGIFSARMIGQHLMLKSVSLGVTTPFFSASLIETVQSDIACEKPGVFDIFKEGLARLVPYTRRLIPIWLLVPPTIVYGVAHYIIANVATQISLNLLVFYKRFIEEKNGAISKPGVDLTGDANREQLSNAIGTLVADAALYPMETVLHRLHLQGSRTIIDNLDTGLEVVPVITRYEGFFDCCESVRSEEGFSGFYRGFGALILQYALRILAIKSCTLVAKEIVKFINQTNAPISSQASNGSQIQSIQSNIPVSSARHININERSPADHYERPTSRQDEIFQHGDVYRGYIPASAFTEDNDPYRHVRHAM